MSNPDAINETLNYYLNSSPWQKKPRWVLEQLMQAGIVSRQNIVDVCGIDFEEGELK